MLTVNLLRQMYILGPETIYNFFKAFLIIFTS